MPQLGPQFYKDFSSGMVSNIAPNLMPKNAARLIVNMDADNVIGSLTTRLGTSIINAQIIDNKPVLGLHYHAPAGATGKLFAVLSDGTNNDVYLATDATKSLQDDTKDLKTRFLTYLGETLRLNGTDNPKAWNGSSWITTGGAFDLTDMPTGHKYAEEFLSRVYLAGKTGEPNRVEYSDVPTSGAIVWNSPVDFIEFEAEDNGGNINALSKVPGYLLVFKERSMHRWNYYNAFPEQMIDIGTPSNESVVKGHGLVAFFSASSEDTTGFYITNGNRPVPISHDRVRNIKKWVDAILPANYANIAGSGTDRIFAWSVGDLTVDGDSYQNVVLRYNRILDQWTIREYPTQFRVFANYTSSNTTRIVGGDEDGCVLEIDKAATYTDYPSSTPISFTIATQYDKFNYNQKKFISEKAVIDCDKLRDVTVEVRNEKGEFTMGKGEGRNVVSVIKELFWRNKLQGNKFSVIVRGQVGAEQGVFHEIEIPDIEVVLNY